MQWKFTLKMELLEVEGIWRFFFLTLVGRVTFKRLPSKSPSPILEFSLTLTVVTVLEFSVWKPLPGLFRLVPMACRKPQAAVSQQPFSSCSPVAFPLPKDSRFTISGSNAISDSYQNSSQAYLGFFYVTLSKILALSLPQFPCI